MRILRVRQAILLCTLAVCLGCSAQTTERGDDSIQPSSSLPATTPWNLAALSRPPQFRWIDQKGKIRSLYYMGMPYKGRPTVVFAYYATPGSISGDPSKDKDLPAIVLAHGGGGRAYQEWVYLWAKRGYAAIAMDLSGRGYEPDLPDGVPITPMVIVTAPRKRLKEGGPDQDDEVKFRQVDAPVSDQWTYHAVANVILAHSLIRRFKEVDADRTAIEGNSWGGYVTLIAAALDNRFKAAVNVFGSGFLHENSSWLSWFDKMTTAQKRKWVQLWDPSMYIGSATVPILFASGATEVYFPIDSLGKTYHLWRGDRELRLTSELTHLTYYRYKEEVYPPPIEIELFVNHALKSGAALPKITDVKFVDSKVFADVESETKLLKANITYTNDKGAFSKRKWQSKPARIEGKKIISEAPPKDATAWFITVTDERGAAVSSEPVFADKTTIKRKETK